jgi:Predicted membrane protein (DUF2254)
VGSVVVALNRTGIANLAGQYDAVIELVPAIGDHVPAGGTLLKVYGPRELPERRLRRAVLLGDERTIEDDPALGSCSKTCWYSRCTAVAPAIPARMKKTQDRPVTAEDVAAEEVISWPRSLRPAC